MAGNSFGQSFRITTAGESHGPGNVVIIDGVPPGIPISVEDLLVDLNRRKPGQSKIVTQRKEADHPEILSGVFEGITTGTSLAILIRNEDQRSKDYSDIKDKYRPGHADYTYDVKYGFRDYRGGGRSSARETNVRVAAGVVAKKILDAAFGGRVIGYVTQVGHLKAEISDPTSITAAQVETFSDGSLNPVRCPDHDLARQMFDFIDTVRKDGDSIGGVAEIAAINIPAGLGEPVFDKLKADIAKALFSIPAVLGVEYGSGFGCATMRGSENNDHFVAETSAESDTPVIATDTNRHGGNLGGISTGQPLVFRAAVKPTSSLLIEQPTVTSQGEATTIRTKGRHDPCLLPRFVPIAEAMIAITLADHWLRWRAQCAAAPDRTHHI
ncbi:chorismate synthase [Gimesia algae]|uniref:Chorismate synthase n=1 Tax=Gimesia algae TaxID=2527971 RepID=A0A517VK23_9PLAN|nr:chorismate synthase [Gimesia algae]QDT93369.1 Chorismate synthase [Gimesia algae]